MAYLHNNHKIKKERDIKIIKRNMKLKLELVQEQLSGTKFGQIAHGGVGAESVAYPARASGPGGPTLRGGPAPANPFLADDSEMSVDSQSNMSPALAPVMMKGVSTYDPEVVKKEEKELEKKRLELEKNEKDLELFQEFNESEQMELEKLDILTKIFLFLRRNITNPIFSCDEIDIKYAVKDFSAGALHCQNRIERIAKKLIKTAKEKEVLKGLTERKTMIFNIFSTLIYCIVSNTAAISYMFMFLNCMCTGNLMSLLYPLSVLLYALIEDPRPRSRYWSIILIYAEAVILFKFLIQQNALTVLTPGSLFVEIVDKFKIGFRVFDKKEYARGIFSFIIWDILVALSVLLHQHCLVVIGLWKKRECDIENIDEAKRRLQGHIERYKLEQSLKTSPGKRLIHLDDDSDEYASDEEFKIDSLRRLQSDYQAQSNTVKDISPRSDETKNNKIALSKTKTLKVPNFKDFKEIEEDMRRPTRKNTANALNQSLSEGDVSEEDPQKHALFGPNYFIHEYSSDTDRDSVHSCEARIRTESSEDFSHGILEHKNMSEKDIAYYQGIDDEGIIGMQNALIMDYYAENQDDNRLRNRITFRALVMENDFLLRIFPRTKQEKPGVDFYNYGVVFQFSIVIYILFFFSQMTGEKEELSETFKFKRFRTEMIFFMFIQIMLILLDRFFYISNTFDQYDTDPEIEDENDPKSVISTVMHHENRHNFFKLLVYIALVILVHITVVWYFPITGNYKIGEQIYCDPNSPCNDLSENQFLWGFYILYIGYFTVTALQFRYGLPEIRKGHFMYEKVGFFYTWAFNAFFYIPFLFEVKTFIDWTFTRTSLKIWEWFTFETIYSEFYGAKVSAEKDKNREIGDARTWMQKVIFGCTGLTLCLGLILAPLVIFSSLNPIAELNLVKGAGIELNIELEEGKSLYNIFSTTVANEIRNLTEEEFSLLSFRKYKELRVSDHTLYQRVEMLPYSDKIWNLSPPAIRKMKNHFENAMKNNFSDAAISLEYSFNRQYPPGSNKLQRFLKKKIMDIDNYPEIFKSFYEALNSNECKPVFIKLDRFYPSVIHLTNEIEPEIIPIKYKTINLKIFCTNDPLIGGNTVKYWTMYIDDDLDIARRKKQLEKEEQDDNRISINLHPPKPNYDDDDYVYENKETMGIYDEPSNNQQIIDQAFRSQDSVPVHIEKPKPSQPPKPEGVNKLRMDEGSNRVIKRPYAVDERESKKRDLHEVGSLENSPPLPPSENTTETEKASNQKNKPIVKEFEEIAEGVFEEAKDLTSNITHSLFKHDNATLEDQSEQVAVNETAQAEQLDEQMKLKNETAEAEKYEQQMKDMNTTMNELDIKDSRPYSLETQAKIEDEKHVGGDSIKKMGEQEEQSPQKQLKDEDDSAKQMGVVLYTFSDKVTPGLLQYSVITFYVSVVFVAGKLLRGYLWGDTSKIYLSELPYPDELLVICEGVVISRMQKDIYREEELYLVLIDLIRSPEVLKIITHPNLKPKED